MRLWGDVVDRRKVEAYLLEVYNLEKMVPLMSSDERFLIGKPLPSTAGPIVPFGKYLLNATKGMSLFALLLYAFYLGTIFFDSWASFTSLNFREGIDTNRLIFALSLIPLCTLAAILTARFRIPRMKVVGSSRLSPTFVKVLKIISFSTVPVVIILNRMGLGMNIDLVYYLLIFVIMGLLGMAMDFCRLYLLRKYCPYLANYAGGEIERPDEPDA